MYIINNTMSNEFILDVDFAIKDWQNDEFREKHIKILQKKFEESPIYNECKCGDVVFDKNNSGYMNEGILFVSTNNMGKKILTELNYKYDPDGCLPMCFNVIVDFPLFQFYGLLSNNYVYYDIKDHDGDIYEHYKFIETDECYVAYTRFKFKKTNYVVMAQNFNDDVGYVSLEDIKKEIEHFNKKVPNMGNNIIMNYARHNNVYCLYKQDKDINNKVKYFKSLLMMDDDTATKLAAYFDKHKIDVHNILFIKNIEYASDSDDDMSSENSNDESSDNNESSSVTSDGELDGEEQDESSDDD